MKCRNCPKPATLHITEIVKGVAQELHLCDTCAQQYLSTEKSSEPDDAVSAEAGEGAEGDQELDRLDKIVCPTCSQTFREFRNAGRLGCPHCYHAFESELIPLLENIHGETRHCGKFPRRAPHDSQKQYELIKLRNDLRMAVEEELYEDAARLRDRIHAIESELRTTGPQPEEAR